jgi:hypothetical protein
MNDDERKAPEASSLRDSAGRIGPMVGRGILPKMPTVRQEIADDIAMIRGSRCFDVPGMVDTPTPAMQKQVEDSLRRNLERRGIVPKVASDINCGKCEHFQSEDCKTFGAKYAEKEAGPCFQFKARATKKEVFVLFECWFLENTLVGDSFVAVSTKTKELVDFARKRSEGREVHVYFPGQEILKVDADGDVSRYRIVQVPLLG